MVFPSSRPARRRGRARVVAGGLVVVLTGTLALSPLASADDDLQKRKNQVHRQVDQAQGDLQESSKALQAAARTLTASRAALASAQRRLTAAQAAVAAAAAEDARMQTRLEQAQAALEQARLELEAARAKVREQRRQIGELAASNYINGDPDLLRLKVLLNSQDPAEATQEMGTVDALMSRQTSTLEELRDARHELVLREVAVEDARRVVAEQRRQAAANLARTQELEDAAATARTSLAAAVAKNRAAEAAAQRARRADAVQLRALRKQEARIKRLILERAAKQRGGYRGDAGGFLYRPVPGAVTSPYGWRRHPIYGYWGMHDGTDFRTPCGQPMRAAGSGTVISRSYSDVYGNRLYLDVGRVNGRNLTVVYNHATGYRVGVGERVSRGEVVGYAGSTGWSTGCHLHFTVLRDGQTVDPMGYM